MGLKEEMLNRVSVVEDNPEWCHWCVESRKIKQGIQRTQPITNFGSLTVEMSLAKTRKNDKEPSVQGASGGLWLPCWECGSETTWS